jgi:hypothetical protein
MKLPPQLPLQQYVFMENANETITLQVLPKLFTLPSTQKKKIHILFLKLICCR